MYMAYSKNPHLPRVRRDAARLVLQEEWSTREVARYTGFAQSTIVRWVDRASLDPRMRVIPTLSSRPHHHQRELPEELVARIVEYRRRHRRCAEVIHHLLLRDGYAVSLSSVKRVLVREGEIRRSPWKRWHKSSPRPAPERPGTLVELDTVHIGMALNDRLYVYTLLDVCSRWAFAEAEERISTHRSLRFVEHAQSACPAPFRMLQSDHGPEFSVWFTKHAKTRGYAHRHIHVRSPAENGHLERFNRTIQEECLSRLPRTLSAYRKALPEYLDWYNTKRPHLALDMKSPLEVMRSY